MKGGFRLILLFASVIFHNVSAVHAETLQIGVGLSKPPYVISETNSGAEYEIVERALKIAGYDIHPRYMPMLRIAHGLNGGALDGGMHMRTHMDVQGFISDTVLIYQNFAISRADEDIVVKRFSDLSDISVVAFQNAQNLLGDSFKSAIQTSHKYSEIPNQELQVKMLEAKRVQVVIADFRIFLHFKKELERKENLHFDVKFHNLFEPTDYHVAFAREKVRDDFNHGLAILKETGEYDAILAKYISPDDLKKLIDIDGF